MQNGLGVREAESADLPAIDQVHHDAGLLRGDHAQLEAAIADPGRFVVVAEVGGQMAGWAKTHYWSDGDGVAPAGHYLGGLTVASALRRGGIGSALTQARLEWIWQQAPEAWYVTNARNHASIALHRRYGFEEVARASRFHTTTFAGGLGILWRATPWSPAQVQYSRNT
ncbi:GNAT family N-acetyltransferase [Arthrobacter castelli]|uniref:GNAT family N-acetyltransferase n=1 Tax=Arthrobacter castelli TaxID=271431 RepID=UPI00040CCE7B|nr:GNAT family N-acetyltransferase [Arthrobacter castelli]